MSRTLIVSLTLLLVLAPVHASGDDAGHVWDCQKFYPIWERKLRTVKMPLHCRIVLKGVLDNFFEEWWRGNVRCYDNTCRIEK